MTSCIIKVRLALLEQSIINNQNKMLATGNIMVNDITVDYRLDVKVDPLQAKIYVYMRPQTCDVFPSVSLKSEFGFQNRNGNMCRKKTHMYNYVNSDSQLYGAWFYSVNKDEVYKIRQSYSNGEGDDAKIHVKLIIVECSMVAQYGRVLRAIYLKQDAGIVDRLLKELDGVRTNYMESENRNQELLELVETLRSDLSDAKERPSMVNSGVSPVPATPTPTPTPTPTINDIISRLSLEELTETANKVKERIEDIRRCKICLSSCSVVMMLPCRHTCMCSECNDAHEQTNDTKCPICRSSISDRIKIYM
jgi:hypothetical protein